MRLLETVREKQKGRQRTVPKIEINCEFALPGVSRTHLFHIPPFVCIDHPFGIGRGLALPIMYFTNIPRVRKIW